ncbi:efflux RND transporter periplasmic adaptor subunit [Aliamphritea ceti]|uniref:efflux RND transporter periplasmic adaptor subunit n=1 Tax=Aliamphritea ceti TaxID=1524258 RepID=UPI0021C3BF65|nr:hypothetical protein [Aliamphritea ceti]
MSQTDKKSWFGRFWALPAVVLLGIVIALVIVKSQPKMQHQVSESKGAPVTTLQVAEYQVKPGVTGYGEVEPDILLDVRAEVAGKVVYVHPQLKQGVILPAGTLVVQVDDSDYMLALKKAEATLAQNRANLAEQDITRRDAELDLKLAKDKLTLTSKELVRFEQLLKKRSVAQSQVDSQRNAVLQARQEVQSLQNSLDALPYSTEVLQAQLDIAEAEVAAQALNLERTQVHLPFDARIASQSVETNQYVGLNASLFSAQTIDKVLVNAQFALPQMRLLSRGFDLPTDDAEVFLQEGQDAENLMRRLGLTASVSLVGHDASVFWEAKVERISNNLDPVSRTVGVIISVSRPYEQVEPGIKPPLIDGMYMQVELQGRAQPFLVVPRTALHEGELYLVDAEQKLVRQPVEGFPQQQMLLLDPQQVSLLSDQVITSDLFPAVSGMLLETQKDTAKQQVLADWLEAH